MQVMVGLRNSNMVALGRGRKLHFLMQCICLEAATHTCHVADINVIQTSQAAMSDENETAAYSQYLRRQVQYVPHLGH